MSKLVDLDAFIRAGGESPRKVLIVDDHPVIRLAVRLVLTREGYEVVAETDNGVDAIALARDHLPDLVILDIGIPKLGGLDVIARISSLDLPLRVLVLTGQNPSHYAARCMQAGAAGFVCKEGDLGELTASVRAVLSGYSYFPSEVIRTGKRQGGMPDDSEMIERLSDRELVVLKYLANGYTNKQIASEMFISNKTVSTYKSRLLLKLNSRSLIELVEFANRNELV
ncbi:DNA-binding response regulator [Pseudomonas tohonis]|uniref:DNA-binding response regulator n=1 Tax=Pseudomonas tohonis TaxID=2725477 RepID=A0A6J4E2K0_9PSED|nr:MULTISPECIES: response regulator transcription factor [Pseudomonas]BBP82033.1 DNA-binding response regulator [Pseudomonas sp. Pc102]BCG23575.1 DNA-binding response regulator [Pseudomonas tohonis]GJN51619.1 DNA-binding response regulator [Pseudomonas tohonis]